MVESSSCSLLPLAAGYQFSFHCCYLKVPSGCHMACVNTLVRVKQGELRGVVEKNVYGDRYLAFRGIPYAKPPVGPLRFKDPEPGEPWTDVRDASNFGDMCAQFDNMTNRLRGSDDCLYLNVYRPVKDAPTKRAVMFWLHGGAFKFGSGNSDAHGPDYLIRKDIVLVTINYRVGVLGFLNLEHEVATGNQGLKDQVMALKWVQENIAAFGGDSNNVTIFGSSGGAGSVHYLTLSPLSQGLFHKAIAQSGVVLNPWAVKTKEPSKYVYKLAAKLGENSTDPETVVQFLRTVDTLKLVTTEDALLSPMERLVTYSKLGPGVDDKSPNPFMPQHPSVMMKTGVKVPFMIGYCENEGSMLVAPYNQSNSKEILQAINENFELLVPEETRIYLEKEGISAEDIKRLYLGDKLVSHQTKQQCADYISDVMFIQGTHQVLDNQLETTTTPTYFYKFTFDGHSLWKLMFNISLPGASHGAEGEYLLCPHFAKKLHFVPAKPKTAEYTVMEHITQLWTDFAKTGNPTPQSSKMFSTIWKPIEKSDSYDYLNINTTLRMEKISKKEQRCNWKERLNKLRSPSAECS